MLIYEIKLSYREHQQHMENKKEEKLFSLPNSFQEISERGNFFCLLKYIQTHSLTTRRRTINLFNLIIRCFAFSMEHSGVREGEWERGGRKSFIFLACFSSFFLPSFAHFPLSLTHASFAVVVNWQYYTFALYHV